MAVTMKESDKLGFLNLSGESLAHFNAIAKEVQYRTGSFVLREGDAARGIHLICAGEVKLFATSSEGNSMIVKVAKRGDVLGLSSVISGSPYELSGETLRACTVKFISQRSFLGFLAAHAEVGYTTALTLAREHREVFQCTRRLALSKSIAGRIAQILIHLAESQVSLASCRCFAMDLTHAELAGMAGASRETVTRLLNKFERSGFISRDHATITILQPSLLQQLAD